MVPAWRRQPKNYYQASMLAMSPGINNRRSAPKGREISAQGFNPGLVDRIRCALKVASEEASLGHRYANSTGCRKSGASRQAFRSRSFNGSTPSVGEGSRPRPAAAGLLAKPSTLLRSWAKIHLLVETRPRGARGRAPSLPYSSSKLAISSMESPVINGSSLSTVASMISRFFFWRSKIFSSTVPRVISLYEVTTWV
jgi:hypothetical protein